MKTTFLSLLLCSIIAIGITAKLPQSFKRCKVSPELDNKPNECLSAAMTDALQQLADGNKDIGIYPFDPLRVSEIHVQQGDDRSPVAVELKFINISLSGSSRMRIRSVSGKLSSPKNFRMQIDFHGEDVKLDGPYFIKGKILILPIRGEGISNMTMSNMTGTLVLTGQPLMRKGKEYLKITSSKLEVDLTRFRLYLSNLFNGDKALGDNMNRFLNENWYDIFTELKPSILPPFGTVFEVYSKRILERIPFKNIFITE